MDIGIVKKNSYDFSAVKEVLNEVNNNEFKSGESDFYSLLEGHLSVDTSKSYIWTALSAVADDTMEALYQNVLNYIDNASNIDTCTVKALQSMVQILGTKFSIFDGLAKCPPEVMNLVDVFSMRKDYLLNSEKVCQQLVQHLSGGEDSVISSIKVDEETSADYIAGDKLDNLISCTFYSALSSHVYRTYGTTAENSDYIYAALSNEILNDGFTIPNAYAGLIQNYKTKWNIGSDFDVDLEADNIDNGLSIIDDYSEREQTVLSVEFVRRHAAKNDLEPKSRFAYYKELDVKTYFSFIEETYNNSYNVYSSSTPYAVDKNYIEIRSLASAAHLLVNNGGSPQIDTAMLSSVATRLCYIVTQIREIREYLKSHVQRNYMKGTFLLLSYIVNEYLRNNVYPILPEIGYDEDVKFVQDNNKLELVEYIDQSQYNNIQTEIEEDADDHTLNPPYWKDNGANGAAIALDSTNVFRPADKLKVVTSTIFSPQEIEDFYVNVLNNETGISRLSTHESLYDFLTTLFKVGADNSYMTDAGKVMCELQNTTMTDSAEEWSKNRKFTKDIDSYINALSAAYQQCVYLLNGYEPLPNTSYQTQFDEIHAFYTEKAAAAYISQLNEKMEGIDGDIYQCTQFVDEVSQLIEQFNQLTAQFTSLVVSNTPYVGEFVFQSTIFRSNLNRYLTLLDNSSFAQKSQVQQQLYQISSQYSNLLAQAKQLMKMDICTEIRLNGTSFNDTLLTADYNIQMKTSTIDSYYRSLHGRGAEEFEDIENRAVSDINALQTALETQKSTVNLKIINEINSHKSSVQYAELMSLSTLLSDFLDVQSDIHQCTSVIADKLDYTKSDWYKYKKNLFYKYTGLSTSELPFYYIENVKHPSYQIHPCLSNFIEYVDFSFPIKNLAGLAQKTISDIANTAAQLCIDNDGYLLSVWNSPLNSNQDYMTRYEKSSHIDELGNVNKHFGFDGLAYPDVSLAAFDDIAENLSRGDADKDIHYSGLNISVNEGKLIAKKLSVFMYFYKWIINNHYVEIKRYANDVYGNSYILVKTDSNSDNGILFFRAKNYPIAFPALVYNAAGIYQKDLSEIDLTYDNANQYFGQLKRVQIPFADSYTGHDFYYTPAFADFTFATDKTTMILNGFKADASVCTYRTSIPVIANIVQEYQHDIDKQYYVRTLARDKTDRSLEHLEIPAGLSAETYYYDGRHIGQIYAALNSNTLSVGICKYMHDNVNAQYRTVNFISGEFSGIKASNISDIKFSCRSDGTFSIAYIPADGSLTGKELTSYTGSKLTYNTDLTSTINTFDMLIRTHDFVPMFESAAISQIGQQNYAPYTDMGFIRIIPSQANTVWELSSTTFTADFAGKKTLQFEFDKPLSELQASKTQLTETGIHGIDFKFICPIRVEEYENGNNDTTLCVRNDYENVAFQTPYGKYPLTDSLKHYAITDAHMYDTVYNEYVLKGHIPEYLDLVAYEQTLFDAPNGDGQTVFTEYIDLMRYDVARYLSAQCEEYRTSLEDYPEMQSVFENENYQFMTTEPFFVNRSQWNELSSSSYLSGYVNQENIGNNINYAGSYRFSLADGIEISAEVMKNDYGTVKIDFNPIYYFKPQAALRGNNIANMRHLFLNLDKPGDSGYLNICQKSGDSKVDIDTEPLKILATVFIKNISTNIPRFVLKAVYLYSDAHTSDNQQYIEVTAEKESHMFRAESQNQHEYMLVDESLEALPIDLS